MVNHFLHVKKLVTLGVLLSALAVLLFSYDRFPGERGPVQSASLHYPKPLHLLYPGYRDTDFDPDIGQERAIMACRQLLGQYFNTVNGQRPFADAETKTRLERILREQPDCFYAEYLLSLWFRLQGDPIGAKRHMERALARAPVILVQAYRDQDGNPLRNLAIQKYSIACCRVRNGSLDYVDLEYVDLTTDEAGEIHVPVFDAIYLRSQASIPDGYKVVYPPLGFFRSNNRLGLLPPAFVKECPPYEPKAIRADVQDTR